MVSAAEAVATAVALSSVAHFGSSHPAAKVVSPPALAFVISCNTVRRHHVAVMTASDLFPKPAGADPGQDFAP